MVARRPPRRGKLRLARRIALSVGLGLVLLELALRALLFGSGDALADFAHALRTETNFAHWQTEEANALRARFEPEEAARRHRQFDRHLGWRKAAIAPESYRHAEEDSVGDRRPVLLYGDSFAACTTRPVDCWEGLLERSDLADRFRIVNYGVGGYGLDQIYLLLERTIDHWASRNPLIVIGVLVDDDLDRSAIRLRAYPKPRFALAEGRLTLEAVDAETAAEWIERHPPRIASYAWRYFLFGAGVVPTRVRQLLSGEARDVGRKKLLNEALIAQIERLLDSRGLESFFVLFHGNKAVHTVGPYTWRERFLCEVLAERSIPYVSSKRFLLEDAAVTGRGMSEYFIPEGHGRNHYPAEVNAIVFGAIRAGIEGRYEPAEYLIGAPLHPRERRP